MTPLNPSTKLPHETMAEWATRVIRERHTAFHRWMAVTVALDAGWIDEAAAMALLEEPLPSMMVNAPGGAC